MCFICESTTFTAYSVSNRKKYSTINLSYPWIIRGSKQGHNVFFTLWTLIISFGLISSLYPYLIGSCEDSLQFTMVLLPYAGCTLQPSSCNHSGLQKQALSYGFMIGHLEKAFFNIEINRVHSFRKEWSYHSQLFVKSLAANVFGQLHVLICRPFQKREVKISPLIDPEEESS